MTTTDSDLWLWPPPEPIGVPVIDREGKVLTSKFPINRIFCVGRNYEAHAAEMHAEVDREAPFYFTKSPSAISAQPAKISYPPGTKSFHHEVELVVALDLPGHKIAVNKAPEHIYGYACGIDFTRRDLQNKAKADRKPWDLSKDIENGAAISAIRQWPKGQLPTDSAIELRVNGKQQQLAKLSQMVWSIPEIIAHLSEFYHLVAGDLIYTGTPAGVGALNVDDRVEASITDVGKLELLIST